MDQQATTDAPSDEGAISVAQLPGVHDRTNWGAMTFSDAAPDGGGDQPWPGGDLNHTT
jgi:hypothetical protein